MLCSRYGNDLHRTLAIGLMKITEIIFTVPCFISYEFPIDVLIIYTVLSLSLITLFRGLKSAENTKFVLQRTGLILAISMLKTRSSWYRQTHSKAFKISQMGIMLNIVLYITL